MPCDLHSKSHLHYDINTKKKKKGCISLFLGHRFVEPLSPQTKFSWSLTSSSTTSVSLQLFNIFLFFGSATELRGGTLSSTVVMRGTKILPLQGYNSLVAKGRTAAQAEQTWNWVKLIRILHCRISVKLSDPLLVPELPAETPYILLTFLSGIKLLEVWLPRTQPPPGCSEYVLSKMQSNTGKLNWGIHPMEWNVLPIQLMPKQADLKPSDPGRDIW